jgi:hypothetical protein
LKYQLRGKEYSIALSKGKYSISVENYSISENLPFAVNWSESGLEYFNGTTDKLSLKICGRGICSVNVVGWSDEKKNWQVTSGEQRMKIDHELYNLEPGRIYNIDFNGERVRRIKADPEGIIRFKSYAGEKDVRVQIAAIN